MIYVFFRLIKHIFFRHPYGFGDASSHPDSGPLLLLRYRIEMGNFFKFSLEHVRVPIHIIIR